MPNKLLGQNFLQNQSVVRKIVAAVDVGRGDEIIEIGPGRGELTMPLVKKCHEVGVKLIAIEKDEKLAEKLRIASDEFQGDLEIISSDALDFFSAPRFPISHWKVVGNLPYYLTGHILRLLSEMENRPEQCVFMVQEEVAERMVAQPPDMNRLAASVQYWATPKILMRVPRSDFLPQPNVDSAVVVLEKLSKSARADGARYFAAVRALFAQPRKTILNNLDSVRGNLNKSELAAELEKINIKPRDRPQDLSVGDIANVARKILTI